MEKLLYIFKALSDETRLRILKLIEKGELCVCDLVAALGISQPRASFHLGVLKEAGLIKDRKSGKWTRYSIDDADLFKRFLLLNILEKLPAKELSENKKRLKVFLRSKESNKRGFCNQRLP